MQGRHDLTDAEWAIISPLLPDKPRGVPRVDDRRAISGIFHILRTGTPWHDLPERCGPHATVCNRWARQGVRERLFGALAGVSSSPRLLGGARPPARRGRKKGGPDHAIGRSRGGLSTKIHVVVDGLGLPRRFVITPGQASDKAAVPALLDGLEPARDTVADRGSGGAVSRGKSRGLRCYRCKPCGRTFGAFTGTARSGLHRKERWLAFATSLAEGATLSRTLPKLDADSVKRALAPVIAPDALLVSDAGHCHRPAAAALGILHESVTRSAGERVRGALHIQTATSRHSQIKGFLRRF